MRCKKHIALFLITAIIGFNLLMPTKKAEAFLGIGDFGVTIDLVQETIKLILNTAAHSLARQIVSKLVSSTVTWANSGFKGNPVFVQNPTRFLANAANNSAQGFITGIGHGKLGFLCSPFQQQIQLSLKLYYYNGTPELDNQGALQCTWTGVTANMQSFLNGKFSDGGWKGWFSMTQEPTNNVYAAGVQAQIDFAGQLAQAAGQTQTDITKSHGFLDIPGDCEVYNPKGSAYEAALNSGVGDPDYRAVTAEKISDKDLSDALNGSIDLFDPSLGEGECIQHGPSKTPGSVIENQLNNSVAAPLSQLISAKDWDEVVGALINGLTQKVFSSAASAGLFGKSASSGLPSGNAAPAIQYGGPTSQGGATEVPDTNGPTNPQLSCSSDTRVAFVSNPSTTVTWKAATTIDGSAEFRWTGDEVANATTYDPTLGYATGTSITLAYKIPTKDTGYFNTAGGSASSSASGLIDPTSNQSYPYKTMHVAAVVTDPQGGKHTIPPVLCRTQVLVNQYHPITVSCTPKANIVHTMLNTPVSWVATITGGSGKFQEIQWDGQQGKVPGQNGDGNRMWPRDIADPTVPFLAWHYYTSAAATNGWSTFDPQTQAGSGITTQTFSKQDNIYTSTVTRIYIGDRNPIGYADASIEVIDRDPTIPAVVQSCSGSIHIDDN